MGASQRRDELLRRQRELRARHDALGGLGAEPPHDAGRLALVFAGTDELMTVVDEIEAGAARRRLVLTFVLLGVAGLAAVLVAAGVLPAYALLAVVVVLAAAVALWRTTRQPHRAGP